jgi:hypothetical protein
MSEQWELCSLLGKSNRKYQKTIYTLTGVQNSEEDHNTFDKDVCGLLSDGWEPFHGLGNGYVANHPSLFFRRRISLA